MMLPLAFLPEKRFMLRALELAQRLTGEDPGGRVMPGYETMTFARYPTQAAEVLAARESLNRLIGKQISA